MAPLNRKPIGKKQAKLIKVLSKDPTLTLHEAGIQAGYRDSPLTRQHVHRALQAPSVQEEFRKAMNQVGCTTLHIAKTVLKATRATKKHFFAKDGEVISERTTADNAVRVSAADLAAKLHGVSHKVEVSVAPNPMADLSEEELDTIMAKAVDVTPSVEREGKKGRKKR